MCASAQQPLAYILNHATSGTNKRLRCDAVRALSVFVTQLLWVCMYRPPCALVLWG